MYIPNLGAIELTCVLKHIEAQRTIWMMTLWGNHGTTAE